MTDVPPPPPPDGEPEREPEWRAPDPYHAYPPPPPSEAVTAYAPWWRRAIAAVLDWLLVAVPIGLFGAVSGLVDVVRDVEGDVVRVDVSTGMSVLVFAAAIVYSGLMDGGRRGATVGKMALLIQVRDAENGGPIGFARAAVRRFVFLILFELYVLPGLVNAVWPLLDPRRQALHDKLARSVVMSAPELKRQPAADRRPPGPAPSAG